MAAFTDVESPGVKIGDGELNEDAHRSPRELLRCLAAAYDTAGPESRTVFANVLVSVKQLQDGRSRGGCTVAGGRIFGKTVWRAKGAMTVVRTMVVAWSRCCTLSGARKTAI